MCEREQNLNGRAEVQRGRRWRESKREERGRDLISEPSHGREEEEEGLPCHVYSGETVGNGTRTRVQAESCGSGAYHVWAESFFASSSLVQQAMLFVRMEIGNAWSSPQVHHHHKSELRAHPDPQGEGPDPGCGFHWPSTHCTRVRTKYGRVAMRKGREEDTISILYPEELLRTVHAVL